MTPDPRRATFNALYRDVATAVAGSERLDARVVAFIGSTREITPVTRSLDAAFALVPDRWWFTDVKQLRREGRPSWWVHLLRRSDTLTPVCSASIGTNADRFSPRTLALAVTAVALNARYSEEVGRDVYAPSPRIPA